MRDFLVYLAGPISGLSFDQAQSWRTYAETRFPMEIRGISPLRCKSALRSKGIITDSYPDSPLTTDRGIITRDRQDCTRADALLVNLLGAKFASPGTSIEFGWADAHRIPTVVVMEPSGNPYDHPMIRELTGFRVTTLDEGIETIVSLLLPEGYGTPRSSNNNHLVENPQMPLLRCLH